MSDEIVKTHVSHVLRKLDLGDRAEAVVVAYESGLVVPWSYRLAPRTVVRESMLNSSRVSRGSLSAVSPFSLASAAQWQRT